MGKGPLSLLKCPEEKAGREEGAAHSLKGKGSWARVEKLSEHKEHPPPNTGTHRDSDGGDRDSPPQVQKGMVVAAERYEALSHYVEGNGSCCR